MVSKRSLSSDPFIAIVAMSGYSVTIESLTSWDGCSLCGADFMWPLGRFEAPGLIKAPIIMGAKT